MTFPLSSLATPTSHPGSVDVQECPVLSVSPGCLVCQTHMWTGSSRTAPWKDQRTWTVETRPTDRPGRDMESLWVQAGEELDTIISHFGESTFLEAYQCLADPCSDFDSGGYSRLIPTRPQIRKTRGGAAFDLSSTVTLPGAGARGPTLTAVSQAGAGFGAGSQGDPGWGVAAETEVGAGAPSQPLAVWVAGLKAEGGREQVKADYNRVH